MKAVLTTLGFALGLALWMRLLDGFGIPDGFALLLVGAMAGAAAMLLHRPARR